MVSQKTELYFLFTLIGIVGVLVFLIFQPFLYPLLLAVIFATVFNPVHKKFCLLAKGDNRFAAALSTVFILVVIVAPLTFLGVQIFKEATQLYASVASSGVAGYFSQSIAWIVNSLGISPVGTETVDIGQYAKQGLSWIIQHVGTFFSNVTVIIVDIFVLLVSIYYLFLNGGNLRKSIVAMSPLQDVYDEKVLRKLELAINSVVRGSISVGIVQGVLTAIGFTIFGVPNAVLWGSVAAISALIPGVGTALVVIPSVIFLFATGQDASAIGLIVWGVVAVGLVDNILGPKLVGRGVQLHPFLVLLSVLGGVGLFGPLGVIFGPLVLSLFFAFLEIYAFIREDSKKVICK